MKRPWKVQQLEPTRSGGIVWGGRSSFAHWSDAFKRARALVDEKHDAIAYTEDGTQRETRWYFTAAEPRGTRQIFDPKTLKWREPDPVFGE